MKVKWTKLGMVVFLLISLVMTGCFIWQYRMPKLKIAYAQQSEAERHREEQLHLRPSDLRPFFSQGLHCVRAAEQSSSNTGNVVNIEVKEEKMCPRFPEPVLLEHPIPALKEALEKIDVVLRLSIHDTTLPALSAIVVFNDSVLWNGNFGRRNGSDPSSPPPNEYTVYRIASLSKIFPTLMLYKLWEEGKVASLDDPLEKYSANFTIKNPLGKRWGVVDVKAGSNRDTQPRSPSVTLRRMAGQLSGLPRRLRSTNLLWGGDTDAAIDLLQDDVLVADPGTKCHYSNVAFSLLANVLAENFAKSDYESWVSDNILEQLGMEDTGFDITPAIQSQMAVGVYSSGQSAPLYDLGWYRPAGQMYSTAADMAKLAMVLLGAYSRPLLQHDTLKTLLTPLFRCHQGYFANYTGTPWEVNEQLGYEVVRKDGDLDGYATTFSLVPRLKLGLVVLMAGVRPPIMDGDLVTQAYSHLIPAMESAFRNAQRKLSPPPDPTPYVGLFTYQNMTFYEIKASLGGVLVMQQFGPQVDTMMLAKYRTIRLDFLQERVFRVVFEGEYPCKLKVNSISVSLETQDRQLFNFYYFNEKGVSPGFDSPGLNTYKVLRIARRPIFNS